jgi:aspartate racemase
MKTIGLIGGMSWESSAQYYRLINEAVRERLGPSHCAPSVMVTVEFSEIERLQELGDWDTLGEHMAIAAQQLDVAGADLIVLCTNTMHECASAIEAATDRPLLHIADAVGERATADGLRTVGLLGTAFTMERDFYRARLTDCFGLDVITPGADDRRVVHETIYRELIAGEIRDASRSAFREIMARLVDRGAEAIILGCTEIMLLVDGSDASVPLLDTTTLHAAAAVEAALAAEPAA